jgi:fermentation-respiration switch protein FrsA (DUF1100 family)
MSLLKSIAIFVLVFYAGLVGLLYVLQRNLMYLPYTVQIEPAAVRLPQAAEEIMQTGDGEKVIVWHIPPQAGKPVILYFHGNGGSIAGRAGRFALLTAEGNGLVALSYRGYGGSSGSPSEAGLMEDAMTAYRFAVSKYSAERIVLWGESLGTGVAVALAEKNPVAKIVLEAPFTSTADIAASIYPIVPVRWLMKDQFRSDEKIGNVTAPILMLHGERDAVVPIRFGERLFEKITSPKRFVRFPEGQHEWLEKFGAFEIAKKFIAEPL